jgi:predicted transcriptional regulator
MKMSSKVKTYTNYLKSGYIQTKKDAIIDIIRKNPSITIYDIRNDYNITHQTLTGIISTLMDDGLVYFCGEKKKGKSYFSMLMYEDDIEKQKVRAMKRSLEKFRVWANRLTEFKTLITYESYHNIGEAIKDIAINVI